MAEFKYYKPEDELDETWIGPALPVADAELTQEIQRNRELIAENRAEAKAKAMAEKKRMPDPSKLSFLLKCYGMASNFKLYTTDGSVHSEALRGYEPWEKEPMQTFLNRFNAAVRPVLDALAAEIHEELKAQVNG